jgi:acetyl-CoA carboxylase carboxyltransferase component
MGQMVNKTYEPIWVEKIELQNKPKEKLTARERVDYLMDEGSFEEMGYW